MVLQFLILVLLGILSVAITYSIGKMVTACLPKVNAIFFSLFTALATGIITIALLVSIIVSSGKTISILLLPIIGLLLLKYRTVFHKPMFNLNEIKTELLWLAVLFLPIFLYQGYFFFDFVNDTVKSLMWDNYAYASYIDSLRIWGAESRYVDMNYFIPEHRTGLMPYHYSELWFSAFWGMLFNISSIKAYYFMTNSILIAAFASGVCSLFEQKIKNKMIVLGFSFLLLFLAGLGLPCYEKTNLLPSLWFSNMSMLGVLGTKMAFIYLYLLLSIVFIKRGESFLGYTILLTIPLFSIGLMPGMWGGMILLTLFEILKQRFTITRQQLYVFGFIGFVLLSFALFYHIFKSSNVDDYTSRYIFSHGIFKGLKGGISFANCKIVIANFIWYSIPTIGLNMLKMVVFFFPFLILIYRSIRSHGKLWLFTLFAVICGATITTLSAGILDTGQFTSNLSVLMAVLIIVGISDLAIETFQKPRILNVVFSVATTVLLVYCVFETILPRDGMKAWHDDDHRFIKQIADKVKSEKTVVCLVFLSKEEYARQQYLWWYDRNDADLATQYCNAPFVYALGNPELYYNNKEIPESDRFAYYHLTPLNAWREKNKKKTVLDFIRKFNIRFLYVKKGVELPEAIVKNTKSEIESAKTGTKFIEINAL